ncbi:hypothetical protein BJ170DRAFT_688514 [Xylariales sp. AK1849]|nr:hypothetical protein BJ170DRAFT_688514 [Xylariales sp. AK1849]
MTPDVALAVTGLEKLQLTSSEGASLAAIDTALAFTYSNLPAAVREQIFIPHSMGVQFFQESNDDFEKAIGRLNGSIPENRNSAEQNWRRQVRAHRYTLWPVNERFGDENHMFVVVFRMGKSTPDQHGYDRVLEIGLAEGSRMETSTLDWKKEKRIIQRNLSDVMNATGFLIDETTRFIEMWVPLQQTGESTCSMRSYFILRQLMERIPNFHLLESGHHESFWDPLSGWFHPEQIRADIAGDCQWAAVRGLDYRGRIAIEIVEDSAETPVTALLPSGIEPTVQHPGSWKPNPRGFPKKLHTKPPCNPNHDVHRPR